MSTNLIDKMTEREAKAILNDICNEFSISGNSRNSEVILANVEGASRRSDCLSRIESHFTVSSTNDDGENTEDGLLNWGESPSDYIETFKDVLEIWYRDYD